MLYGFLIVLHVIVSILLVIAILMQRSKGGGLAGIAGGAASQAVFGGRGAATILHKATIGMAIFFCVNILIIGIISKGRANSVSVTQQEIAAEPFPLDFIGGEEAAAPVSAGEGLPIGDQAEEGSTTE